MKIIYPIAFFAGIACGLLSTHVPFLQGTWLNLVFWFIVGAGIGAFLQTFRQVARAGALYGLALTVTFLLSGFQGTPDKLNGFIVLVLVLCIPGIIGGIASVHCGRWLASFRKA